MTNLRGHQKPGLSSVNYCRALNKPADNISPSSWARLALASALIRESPVGVMSQVSDSLCPHRQGEQCKSPSQAYYAFTNARAASFKETFELLVLTDGY